MFIDPFADEMNALPKNDPARQILKNARLMLQSEAQSEYLGIPEGTQGEHPLWRTEYYLKTQLSDSHPEIVAKVPWMISIYARQWGYEIPLSWKRVD